MTLLLLVSVAISLHPSSSSAEYTARAAPPIFYCRLPTPLRNPAQLRTDPFDFPPTQTLAVAAAAGKKRASGPRQLLRKQLTHSRPLAVRRTAFVWNITALALPAPLAVVADSGISRRSTAAEVLHSRKYGARPALSWQSYWPP